MPHKSRHSPRTHIAKAAWVYVFVRSDGICKVGVSKRVDRRRSGIQVATPDRLEEFHRERPAVMSAQDVEAAVKRLLKPWRVSGEWFECEPELARLAIREVQRDDGRLAEFLILQRAADAAAAAWSELADKFAYWRKRRTQREYFETLCRQYDEAAKLMDELHGRVEAAFPEWSYEIMPLGEPPLPPQKQGDRR